MRCPDCRTELERPGDFCLVCGSQVTDAVVVSLAPDRARVTMFDGPDVLGTTTITTIPDSAERHRERQQRNFVERIAAQIHRKRPESLYVSGERELVRRLRQHTTIPVYRIDDANPVEAYRDQYGDAPVPVVDLRPEEKLGGRHTSLIGDRRGQRAVYVIAENPHVKKVIPGPIDASGQGSRVGFLASVTRATPDGNLRVLLRDGSSVQTVRVVTTAGDRTTGERIGDQLNEMLAEDGMGR